MSGTGTESLRMPSVRPPSSISMLAERLRCSNLQDTPYQRLVDPIDRSETRFLRRARRPKAVNFTGEEVCDINPMNQQGSSTPSSDVDGSPTTCDSGNEDSSESWTGGACSLISSTQVSEGTDGFSIGPSPYPPSLQHCLSTSAPDGPASLFPNTAEAGTWCDAGDRKSCCCFQHRPIDTCEDVPSRQQPPLKRSCRSQSASSNQKLAAATRRGIARPIALRVSQRALYSPAASTVSTANSSTLSSTAYALVASGCVKLRNANATVGGHQLSTTTSRLSWHHPIACGGSSGSNRRYVIHPGLASSSRHSVAFSGPGSEFSGDVKLRKPPSLACISSSNPPDFSHHRLSAFTPTTQSRRISLSGDDTEPTNPITAFFSPHTVSSPCSGVIGLPSSSVLFRPTVSAASSGFFQDSCSLSHSSCSSSTNSDQHTGQVGNPVHQCGLSNKPADLKVLQFDDSTISLSVFDHQQQQLLLSQSHQHSCAMEAANLRCQSQPAGVAGVPTCACGSVASAECLSRQAGLKRRRCSHDVGSVWESDSGAFLLGSHQQVGSFDTTSFNLDAAISNTTAVEMNQEASVSPLRLQQQGQSDLSAHSQDSEAGFLISCRRKELSGLSEASEEEESNEAALIQHQHQSRCALEEYDAGTLTPPPQTRFRPIAPSPSPEDEDTEHRNPEHHYHHHHNSCSTEGSPCSFKTNAANIILSSEDGDENEVDDEDSFGGIAPGLNHRRRGSPMQTEEVVSGSEKFRELDIDMIEQD